MAEFDAMTVNERLLAADLLSEFDAAVDSKDLPAINKVLEKVGLRQDETGMNWPIDSESKASRKTLKLGEVTDAPALDKKGRGWKISDKRLDELHDRAREMKRFASPAHKALAKKFADADMGRYTFKRFAVVGSAIVDFNCHNLGMAIMLEEEGDDEALSKRRDKSLESVGIRIMRIKAEHVLENIEAVLERITLGMRMRISDKRERQAEHRRASRPSRPESSSDSRDDRGDSDQ